MKTNTILQKLFIILALIICMDANAQSPTFDVYITNESYPTAKTYQFDIWIRKTGAGTLEIANLQFGINVNNAFRGTGTITSSYVSNSSMFTASQAPSLGGQVAYATNVMAGLDRVNIPARTNPGCGSGTFVPDT